MSPKKNGTHSVPKLINNRGTIFIKKTYKSGVGTIRRASGTKDPKTYEEIKAAMDTAYDHGNHDTLAAIRDGVISPLAFLSWFRKHGASRVLAIDTSVPIVATVSQWLQLNKTGRLESTLRGYRSHLAGFFAHCKATDTLKVLAKRLESYGSICKSETKHVSFNHCRTALMAFARDEYGKESQVHSDIKKVAVLPVVRKLLNDAVPVNDFIAFTKAMNDTHAEIAWNLAYTGMRINEYLEKYGTWEVKADHIDFTKTKVGRGNKGGNRIIMLPYPVAKSTRQEKAIRIAFLKAKEQTGLSITPHTARKCFAHWASEAGVSDVRIDAYEGRNAETILNRIYKKHEVDFYLKDDARKFRDYVESFRNPVPPPKPKTTIKQIVQNNFGGWEIAEVEIEDWMQ